MFCRNCGKQLADDEKFCSQCGTAVANETVPAEPVVEEQPVTPVVAEQPMTAEETVVVKQPVTPADEQYVFTDVTEQAATPKKKKGVFRWIAAALAVVLVGAVAVDACTGTLKGVIVKTFGADDKYFAYVAEENADKAVDEISDAYGSYIEKMKEDIGAELSVTLNIGDKAKSTLESLAQSSLYQSLDLDWLDSIGVDMDMDVNYGSKAMQLAADLKLNGKSLVNADAILDMDKGEVFLALLSLSENYLKTEMVANEMADMMDEVSLDDIKEVLPSEEVVNKLLSKYIVIACEQFSKVEKSKEELSVGEIDQKVTALEVKLTEKILNKAAIAVLEAVEDDKDLKKVIKNVAEYLEDRGDIEDADDVYDDFLEGVSEALEELEAVEAGSETLAKITLYVDGGHNIVGCKIVAEEEEVLYWATARSGANFATEIKMPDMVIEGSGKEKRDIINGEYTIKAEEIKLCEIALEDFSAKDEKLNGKIRIAPSSELLESAGMGSNAISVLALVDLELELGFVSEKDTTAMDVNILSGNELFVGLSFTATETKADKVKAPSKNVIDAENMNEWVASLDLNQIVTNLEKAGVPSDLVDMIRNSGILNIG